MSIYLWTSWYLIEDSVRNAECVRAIELNLENPEIAKVILLCESPFKITHPKLKCIPIDKRPSYGTFFRQFEHDKYNVLVNTDIVLAYHTTSLFRTLNSNNCYALSRYNVTSDVHSDMKTWQTCDIGKISVCSQDTWALYRPRIRKFAPFDDILMGVPGCDNRVAYELYAQKIIPINPSKSIITYHLHSSEERQYKLTYHNRNLRGLGVEDTAIQKIHYLNLSKIRNYKIEKYISLNIPQGINKDSIWYDLV